MTEWELTSSRLEVGDDLEAIETYYQRGWTDGLPVVPPTEGRVRQFLECCGYRPDQVVGVVPQRRRILTAEKVAINAVMAGCLPAYAPVVMTAVEALTTDRFNLHASTASTGGAAPLIIVGGQIARDLGINSGVDVFGAGYRANATIGRTIRLVLMNLCGAKPGMLDKATLGHPGKYSYCIAENEEASPWEPLRVSKGFPEEVSTVTVVASEAPHYVTNHGSYTPQALLDNLADAMSSLGSFANADWVVVVCPEPAAVLARHRWSRSDVQSYLVENCRRSVADLKRVDRRPGPVQPGDEHEMVLMLSDPEDITLVVAGGGAGGFSAVIPPWAGGKSSRMVTRAIGVCVDC